MRVAIGADHAGVRLKADIKQLLEARGVSVEDVGTHTDERVDYPDFAVRVARQVAAGTVDRGLLFCGSGTGMAIAANKIPGVRAAAAFDEQTAALSRDHNDANVLALGERLVAPELARRIVETFLDTPFGGGRHEGRIAKITAIEKAQTS